MLSHLAATMRTTKEAEPQEEYDERSSTTTTVTTKLKKNAGAVLSAEKQRDKLQCHLSREIPESHERNTATYTTGSHSAVMMSTTMRETQKEGRNDN
jgi:hypothetical protein